MPERDHEPAPQRGDRLGRGYDCFGIAQSFAQCPASRFVPHGAMFQLAVLSDDRPLAKCLDSITVDDLEQHTRQQPTAGAHPLLKPDQVLLVAASERLRSEERSVGKECFSTCRTRGSPSNKKKKI